MAEKKVTDFVKMNLDSIQLSIQNICKLQDQISIEMFNDLEEISLFLDEIEEDYFNQKNKEAKKCQDKNQNKKKNQKK